MIRLLIILTLCSVARAEQLAFDPVPNAASYNIERLFRDGVWRRVLSSNRNIVYIGNHPTGTYSYRVFAVGTNGLPSPPSTIITFSATNNTGSCLMYLPSRADRAQLATIGL